MTDNKHTPKVPVLVRWAEDRFPPIDLKEQFKNVRDLVIAYQQVTRLLHDLTPGGSEFYNDPEYCAKWIRKEREECAALQRGTIKELKAELEATKQMEAKLREALERIKNTYDNVEDLAGVIAKEALNQ